MKAQIIEQIELQMLPYLDEEQMQILHTTLIAVVPDKTEEATDEKQTDYVQIFLAAKRVEGVRIKQFDIMSLLLEMC